MIDKLPILTRKFVDRGVVVSRGPDTFILHGVGGTESVVRLTQRPTPN